MTDENVIDDDADDDEDDEEILFGDHDDDYIPDPDDPCIYGVGDDEDYCLVHKGPRTRDGACENAERIRNEENYERARAYQLHGDAADVD